MNTNKINCEIVMQLSKIKPILANNFNWQLRKIASGFKVAAPAKIQLISAYHKLVKQGIIKPSLALEKLLKKRGIRTLSGVAPIAVLTKPYPCPGQCVFCPSEKNMPKSYLSNEPAVMRAITYKFDPYKQVKMRLQALAQNGHDTDKCELIVMGGTWSYLPIKYQNWFIKRCFDGFNQRTAKSLNQAQKWNERTKYRVIGLTLETRPDYINVEEIKRMRDLGCTRVELGVQSINDKTLKLTQRGHADQQTILATRLLKNAGFKISYHMMPNLPGVTVTQDFKQFQKLFTNQNYQPDMLKIYPCVVTKDAKIFSWFKHGKYIPYSDKQLLDLIVKIKKIIPPYVRISRLIRDIPDISILAGNKISNLRQLINQRFQKTGELCRCIRCREARDIPVSLKFIKLKVVKYEASGGTEYFLSYESKDNKTLFAFLRLRLPHYNEQQLHQLLPEIKDAALIREIHTYGQLTPLSGPTNKAVQHFGLGKKLIALAEKITQKNQFKKLAVISGIGVRQYYQKLNYKLEGSYMIKQL